MIEHRKTDPRKKLLYTQGNGYDIIDVKERLELERYCGEYMSYLNVSRTEREAVREGIAYAEARGFVPYERGMALTPGTKIYFSNRGKALLLAVIGEQTLDNGANIAAAHVDAPRLDIKQMPLYEDTDLAYLRTHYYGGIKKYQWVTIPLELHGVVTKKSGETVEVVIGREADDPRFVITDLLPHLGKDQMAKPAAEVIEGEKLNLLVGSVPYADDCADKEEEELESLLAYQYAVAKRNRVRLAILSLLHDRYGITEEDFLSAELEAVPAYDVCDIGLDRSLIGGYGHDDRVCAFAELAGICTLDTPKRSAVCILADKEEIGSMGVSGMQSAAFEWFMEELCEAQGVRARDCMAHSFCVSADVCNAHDPLYAEVDDIRNAAKLNFGLGLCKFTGSRGKAGSSDASAEVVGTLRRIFADNKVVWQMAELGKVDQGGGGTVALHMANRNIDTIDAGVPVLSMHAPFETVAKFDCYMTFKGMAAFYRDR